MPPPASERARGTLITTENSRTRLRRTILVDTGALQHATNGIGRYLSMILPIALRDLGGDTSWKLVARHLSQEEVLARPAGSPVVKRAGASGRLPWYFKGLAQSFGRIAALATTLPWTAQRLQPDLYWAPAHRLPIWLPDQTARVVTIHDMCWRVAPETMLLATRMLDRSLMPRSLRMADRIIAVSESTRKGLLDFDSSLAERVVVVHEAAENMPSPGTRSSLAQLLINEQYVLFVGSLEPRKNLARLVEAFARLPTALRERNLLVIAGGSGWGGVDVGALAAAHGISHRVRWLGVVGDALLATLYAHARCLAMPSIYEGFGLPVLEALSLGTPALIAGNSSLPEVAGTAGYCVDPFDVGSISAGLAAVLGDNELHARLAAEARPQAAKFSWARAARETLDVFDQAITARLKMLLAERG